MLRRKLRCNIILNYKIDNIMTYDLLNIEAVIGATFVWSGVLGGVYAYFAKRDPSEKNQQKGILRKIIPWIVLCFFCFDVFILIVRTGDYPWKYNLSLQLQNRQILMSQREVIISFCWTLYAFMFRPSDTSWRKKVCKVIAYAILSIMILVFDLDLMFEYGVAQYLICFSAMLVFVVILLFIAHVSSPKKDCNSFALTSAESSQPIIDEASNEEDSFKIECESDMVYCKYCGKRIKADSTFCRYCGKKQLMANDTISSKRFLEWFSERKWYLIVYVIYFFFVLIYILDRYSFDWRPFIAFEILVPLILYVLVASVRYLKNKL